MKSWQAGCIFVARAQNEGMIKSVLLGILLALFDPVLAYLIYRMYGGLALLALLLLPPIVGSRLLSFVVLRLERKAAEAEQSGVGFGERAMLVAAKLLFWYPGPLTTLLGLLLLIRGVRRGLHDWVFRAIGKAALKGSVSAAAVPGGVVFTSRTGAVGAEPIGPLKRAEGRVLDPAGDLPEPKMGGE